MKSPFRQKKKNRKEQILLLNEALEKLVELGISTIKNGKYQYSKSFEQTAQHIISNPPGKLKQLKYGQEVGRKLITQFLALAITKPSRRDINNMITAYICLDIHIKKEKIEVDKSIIPDLAYAIWFLNDNEPTIEEVELWKL